MIYAADSLIYVSLIISQMEFKPENELIFSYEENKHLPATLTLKNTTNTPLIFKVARNRFQFKASNPHKFSIKPNPGLIKQG
jgi:hypothetical protein